ncbi:alpha/beta hydrolase family esterase [Sphingomonas kyeonggiensis]|uniref:Polyhydroxybutyrate depolymerase n=1 Tax=Sphingomonas kyeonggiensis TaxID=1268553 RepID=A0A7W6JU73_9SPHN|nr:PHB depolymerase family esterase [Sphingomonas kyeonggiensis]MBB4099657.1 polyhydroxybutyrate depolymerase [Sphingomonas kyeonggiensis]
MRRQSLGFAMAALAALWSAPAAAKGCSLGAVGQTVRISIGDTGRSAMLHLPTGFSRGRAAPLVMLLHGSGGTGAGMLESSKLASAADGHGFIVLAPDAGIPVQKGFVWNIPGVPSVTGKMPGAEDADDVTFLEGAIDWLAANRCIDPSRVYATGLSGGGRMTSWLGCVAADRFAAIAPVVGLRAGNPLAGDKRVPDPATCQPSRPMPVIAFAGDADRTNPIQGGGAGYWQYTMATALTRWSDLDACRVGPVQRDLDPKTYEVRYSGCRAGAEVIGRITRGAGHVWTADNDAMWAFFAKHRRR